MKDRIVFMFGIKNDNKNKIPFLYLTNLFEYYKKDIANYT